MTTSISTLNPQAISFIPSTSTSQTDTLPTKVVAQILVHEFVKDKRRRGERDVTKSELVRLIEKIICARYGVNSGKDVRTIKAYIASRISRLLPGGTIGFKEGQRRTTLRYRFDMSVVAPLKPTNVLVSFWGLHRHEQAVRPTMAISYRPESFKDKVWSVQEDDLKIFNPCCAKQCDCPPMFGYSVPPDFFGNPFNLVHKCSVKTIHIGHYPASSLESENLLVSRNYCDYGEDLEPLKDDYEDKINVKISLDVCSEEMKSIVAGVCSLLPEKETVLDEIAIPSTCDFYENFKETTESLWDSEPYEDYNTVDDDDCHPLLEEVDSSEKGIFDEECSPIRRQELEGSEISSACNPPCSFWCHSSPKSERSQCTMSSSVISLFNDTTDFLLNTCQLDLEESFKPTVKRSYSTNDCDSPYRKNRTSTNISTSLEDLKVKSDCMTFVKRFRDTDNSWENDSGFVSSQEDFFDQETDGEVNYEDSARMWSIFSAEDSLWKPLPECISQDQSASQKKAIEKSY